MKPYVSWLALIVLVFWQDGMAQLLDGNCIVSLRFRIAGGHNTPQGTTPWMALISNATHHDLCGGTLIHSRFILTAAHCIKDNKQLFVRLGLYDRSCPASRCTEVANFNVIKSISHPQFDFLYFKNDIGILKLDRQVVYNARIRPICIFLGDEFNSLSIHNFSAYGWGETNRGSLSSVLQTIHLSRREGKCDFIDLDSETQICAGDDKGDTCTGDSGGPLVANITYGRYVHRTQIGIDSFGSTYCNSNGVYTNVWSFRQWIKDTIWEESLLDKDCSDTRLKSGSIRQPWAVYILPSYAKGALITKRFVLTVAINLPADIQKIKVAALGGETFSVVSVHNHPQFTDDRILTNNIALLKLDKSVQSSDFFAPICFSSRLQKSVNTLTFLTVFIRSWEYLGLKQENATIVDRKTCGITIQMTVEDNQICVNKTSADFNSNGEIFGVDDRLNHKFILHGIKSFHKNGVVILTNIQSYADWIRKIVDVN
ncbi:serine protease grass-like [Drosophila gunungcola]|uniref:Peptidase S1 domain-containing protein n=1 Tax=Drosophila gunungcola TaxID=103775 RepID=A0A9P9YU32_9MUSC|nr:serine protease grass-like [Drosophila gunungcola]KAI8043164.1 hypothetical protein M5D96_004491 [Drosophila gunungcola]